MITFSNLKRSEQREIMDDLDFGGKEMRKNLDDIRIMNKWFGGNKISINGLRRLLKNHPQNQTITVLDIGCGDGQILRNCADFAMKNNFSLNFIGIDFNQNILELAKEKSRSYPNIKFLKADVFSEVDLIPNCDIAMFTLFLHHFKNEEIEFLLNSILRKTTNGLIINDLHRHKIAFNFFKVISKVFLKSKTAHHDGLVSIARGFKREELYTISKRIPEQISDIQWRWAFRYQLIMKKKN